MPGVQLYGCLSLLLFQQLPSEQTRKVLQLKPPGQRIVFDQSDAPTDLVLENENPASMSALYPAISFIVFFRLKKPLHIPEGQ